MTCKVQKQKHHNLKCPQFRIYTKTEILVDQWSIQSIVTLQRFQNAVITIYSRI